MINKPYLTQSKSLLARSLIKDKEVQFKEYNEILRKYENDSVFEGLSSKVFTASKTATNSLNFISKEEEANLQKNAPPMEVFNVFRFILIMLGEDHQAFPNEKLIETIYGDLMPNKYKVENLSKIDLFYLI